MAADYTSALANCYYVVVPARVSYSDHVYHQYTMKLKGVDRTALQKAVQERDIPAMIYYPIPLHLQKAYEDSRYQAGDFPVAEMLSSCVLSLPMHTELDSEQLAYIVKGVLQSIESL